MANAEIYLGILGFIALTLPILAALWKTFTVREALQVQITQNQHRIEMMEAEGRHLIDNQQHFLNGITERVQHVRDRSKHAEEALDLRLSDLEGFVEKTTAFTRRKRGE